MDDPLGEELDQRLADWLTGLGIFTDKLERLREARFGRFTMLVHPDTDDPDQLMLAARLLLAFFAVDDAFVDDETVGARPQLVGRRLALAMAALDPPDLLPQHSAGLDEALHTDPVLIALVSSMDWLKRSAVPSQLDRVRHEAGNLYLGMNAEAAWRLSGHVPSVWEYLAVRRFNSFLPNMTITDLVGGYHLPAELYCDPRIHHATVLAGSAATLVNDLYSIEKERAPATGDYNLPTIIAIEERCSLQEALERSARYRDKLVRAFEAAHRELLLVPSPELQRYLLGLRAWIGGSDEWHRTSGRYQREGGTRPPLNAPRERP